MSLLNTLEMASRIGWDLTLQQKLSDVTFSAVMQQTFHLNLSKAAVIDGIDALTPLPVKMVEANVANLDGLALKDIRLNFNPASVLTSQSGGQALARDLLTPQNVRASEAEREMTAFEKGARHVERTPLKSPRMVAVRKKLEEKRAAFRQEQVLKLHQERLNREKRMGVVRDPKKYPVTGRKQENETATQATMMAKLKRKQY